VELDKFQFQHWVLSLIDASPLKEGQGKGAIAARTDHTEFAVQPLDRY